MDEHEVPYTVLKKVLTYRTAMMIARGAYERQRDAARRGDMTQVNLLEKTRPDRMYAVDRARVELDEAIRCWE
jgi:hypothetical protein